MIVENKINIKNRSLQPNTNLVNDYFHWLCDIIGINGPEDSYFLLAQTLHKKEFVWFVDNDDNRADDGRQLRERFINETGWVVATAPRVKGFISNPCSVLEMLIALAERINEITDELDNCNKTRKWFWEMLANVKLPVFTDEDYLERGGTEKINYILDTALNRTYKRNGKGGFFPLRKPSKDQRKVEIWYQMCEYLLENYYVDEKKL